MKQSLWFFSSLPEFPLKAEFSVEELAEVLEIFLSGLSCHMTSNMTLPFPQLASVASQRWPPSCAFPAEKTNWLTKRTKTVQAAPLNFPQALGFPLTEDKMGMCEERGRLFKKHLSGFHPAICKGWCCDILWTCPIHSSVLEPWGFQNCLRRGFCGVIYWARTLPGNLGWWRTCGNFTLRGNVVSFGYWDHDVFWASVSLTTEWLVSHLLVPGKWYRKTERSYLPVCPGMHMCVLRGRMEKMDRFLLFCIALSEVMKKTDGIHQQLRGGFQLSGEDFHHRILACSKQTPPCNGACGYFLIILSQFFLTHGSEGFAGTFHVVLRISMEISLWLG